ncbi:MAG: hypothetical protein MZU91_10430 [Desulfosudis oleivorans]|nr:hypothetical protein [Desulfosudis oleivorans]
MEGVSALSFYETNNILTIGPNDHRPLDLTDLRLLRTLRHRLPDGSADA